MSENVVQSITSRYDFVLDQFQLDAIASINEGRNVLVAAPTGSGKTVVAEYAVARAHRAGLRSFYTAPIKALSNQKFVELSSFYGATQVGLLTGDNSINPTAPIVVMTTEVLRNMIYARSQALESLGVVVLDEVHFLQDAYRGPVWEEVIIHLEPTVQLVCLSATVSNATELCDWLTTVRGPTTPIVETKRPIELSNHYLVGDKATSRLRIFDTLVDGRANPEVLRFEQEAAKQSTRQPSRGSRDRQRSSQSTGRSSTRIFAPNRSDIIKELAAADLLPAIFFIFSRNQCDEAARSCLKMGISLTNDAEKKQIVAIAHERLTDFSDDDLAALQFTQFVEQLEAGIGSHHAGIVPTFKEIVETCFARGLVKVVFATETLAVGINMPARAVVLDKITKFNGENHQMLKPSDYAQLTGRAGRRGLDDIGHALVVWSPFVTFEQVATLVASRSFVLNSAFRPTYNMAANLIRSTSQIQARHLLNLSFAQFQSGKDVVEIQARIQRRSKERDRLVLQAESPFGDIDEFRSRRSSKSQPSEIDASLGALHPGDVIEAGSLSHVERMVVLTVAQRANGTKITALSRSRSVQTFSVRDFAQEVFPLGYIKLPSPFAPTNSKFLKEASTRLATAKIKQASREKRNKRPQQSEHPVQDDPDLKFRLIAADSAERIDRELEQLEKRVSTSTQSVSNKFDELVKLLSEWGFVDDWSLTQRGQMLSHIFHESDLLIANCVAEGAFDGLSAVNMAALASVFVYQARGGEEAVTSSFPNNELKTRWKTIAKLSQQLAVAETDHGLVVHRGPEMGFMGASLDWAAGTALADVLEEDEITAGDFVRTIKQLIDLLRQLAVVLYEEADRTRASEAAEMCFRGVVAASSSVGRISP
ncbi:MAG: DEAD/DEAH box helicase [Actinobacteria bacterium]|nr:MAG: DEAD/DEAH box helicase [Actinomycetota bacterium]